MAIIDTIRQKQREQIDKHSPAKNAYIPEDQSDLDAFVAAIDEAWTAGRDTTRNVETDGFHPSSLGIKHGQCARRNAYLLMGAEKQDRTPPRVLRVFANGHAVHDRWQKHLHKMGIEFEDEVVIDFSDPPIAGHCDGIYTWKGKRILLEIKSCSPEVFANRLKWKKPKDEHFDQANIYAYVLGLDTIHVLYEDKGNQEFKIFEVPADRTKAEKIIKEWRATYAVFKAGELPRRPYKPDSATCAGCDLVTHCRADSTVGVNIKDYYAKPE